MPRVSNLLGGFDQGRWEEEIAADAVSFTASKFLGMGQYETRPAATLAEARQHAIDMGGPRKVMIYAIATDGRQVLVEANGKPADITGVKKR